MRAASTLAFAALATACGDVTLPGVRTVATSDLIVLALQDSAPPPATASFVVTNASRTVHTLIHPDHFNTPFAILDFPPGCLASLDGAALGPTDSVHVTVQPVSGEYGVTISPAGLVFTPGTEPMVTFSYPLYADASVADGIATFTDRSAYLAALNVWDEVSLDHWSVADGSGPTDVADQVSAYVTQPGTLLLAAAR